MLIAYVERERFNQRGLPDPGFADHVHMRKAISLFDAK
jgi:hypothetical protein